MRMHPVMCALAVMAGLWTSAVCADDFKPNSFEEVTAHLDQGGDLFVYLSTDTFMSSLTGRLQSWQGMLEPIVEEEEPEATAHMQALFALATRLVDEGGLEQVGGAGFSSYQISETEYRTKSFIHVPASDKPKRFIDMFGAQAHELTALKLLPKHTVLAMNSDFDAAGTWAWLDSLMTESDGPGWADGWDDGMAMLEQQGLDLPALMADMGGEFTFLVTVDQTRQVQIPVDDEFTVEIGEPAMAIVIKVKGDVLMELVDAKLAEMQVPHTKADEDGIRMRLVQTPGGAPFKVMPTIARFDDYLVIASTDTLVLDIANAARGKVPGLASTPEFKAWSRDLPAQGNSFLLVTPTLTQMIVDIQTTMMDQLEDEDPDFAEARGVVDALFRWEVSYMYQVGVRTEDGLLTVGNGNQSGARILGTQLLVVPVAVSAGMLLPVLSKARAKARRVNSAGNIKQIGLGLLMYSGDNRGHFPTPDGAAGLNVLHVEDVLDAGKVYINPSDDRKTPVDGITEATTSYAYIGAGLKDDNDNATIMPIVIEKPTGDPWVNVLFIDGHAEGFSYHGDTIEGVIDLLDDRFDYDPTVYDMLIEKARKMDKAIAAE